MNDGDRERDQKKKVNEVVGEKKNSIINHNNYNNK